MPKSTLEVLEPTIAEFGAWLDTEGFRAPTCTVLHHTWSPRAYQYQGRQTIVGIRTYHKTKVGASDIMANAYACPDGTVVTGRPLSYGNWAHAYISREHPEAEAWAIAGGDRMYYNHHGFGIETVGNFDSESYTSGEGGDSFAVAMDVLAVVHHKFGIPAKRLIFHRDVADKTCPGRLLDREWVREQLALRLEPVSLAAKVVLGDRPIECNPKLVDDDMAVLTAPLLSGLAVDPATVPQWVTHDSGYAFIHDLAPYCKGWDFFYRSTSMGPRVYCKAKEG